MTVLHRFNNALYIVDMLCFFNFHPYLIYAGAFQIITKMASNTGFPEFGKEVRKLFMLRDGVCLNHGSYGCVPREVHEEQIRYIIQKYGHDTRITFLFIKFSCLHVRNL